jgi:hypothetical protein
LPNKGIGLKNPAAMRVCGLPGSDFRKSVFMDNQTIF